MQVVVPSLPSLKGAHADVVQMCADTGRVFMVNPNPSTLNLKPEL
jgi:hypothetical protein